ATSVISVIVSSSNHTGLAGQRTITLSGNTAVTTGASSAGVPSVVKLVASDDDVRPKLSRSQKRAQ
ncbi:hypothetical protein EMGBD1_23390, partial [Anaerolineaceae bacterium]